MADGKVEGAPKVNIILKILKEGVLYHNVHRQL